MSAVAAGVLRHHLRPGPNHALPPSARADAGGKEGVCAHGSPAGSDAAYLTPCRAGSTHSGLYRCGGGCCARGAVRSGCGRPRTCTKSQSLTPLRLYHLQPPKKDDKGGKKKESSSGGGKAKKKKWSKGKQKEKLNAAVFFDKNLYEKLKKEVPNYKLITPSIISERMRCNVSMARRAINDLLTKGMIKVIAKHQKQAIYTRALAGAE